MLTAPSIGDLENAETHDDVLKYMATNTGTPAEDRLRLATRRHYDMARATALAPIVGPRGPLLGSFPLSGVAQLAARRTVNP